MYMNSLWDIRFFFFFFQLNQGIEKLKGAQFQRPPLISAVKRQLRIRTVYQCNLLEYDQDKNMGKSWLFVYLPFGFMTVAF